MYVPGRGKVVLLVPALVGPELLELDPEGDSVRAGALDEVDATLGP